MKIPAGKILLDRSDFGLLVEYFVRAELRFTGEAGPERFDRPLREWWPELDDYDRRHIQCDIEVAIAMDEPPRYGRAPLANKALWVKFIEDVRPPKAAFTVNYRCNKCKQAGLKLWRGVHGCEDSHGHKLLCAACLAPGVVVDANGKCTSEYGHTDQVNGWLPAIPVDDTYWGYTSVPSQDVEWWQALPTYASALLAARGEA